MSAKANASYSAADFARYHSGEMTAQDRHALEKAALSDPFLADALEGYRLSPTPAADLSILTSALADRIQKRERKKVFFMPQRMARLAAACLMIAVIGWLAYQIPSAGNTPVAMEGTTPGKAGEGEKIAVPVTNTDSLVSTGTPAATEIVIQNKPALNERAADATKETIAGSTAAAPQPSPMLPTLMTRSGRRLVDSAVGAAATALGSQSFGGIVTDTTGRAIPFASIEVAQTGAVLQTDLQGRFTVAAPDTAATVIVTAAGYERRRQQLEKDVDNKLVLPESNSALKEVVVTGMGAKKGRSKLLLQEGQLEPKEGWNHYNNYLAANLEAPEEMTKKTIQGDVTLAFEVNAQGAPVNIRVVKSLCETCDQKAIRLLKEGPKWKTGTKRRGKIVFRF
jgi:hypothetical protein